LSTMYKILFNFLLSRLAAVQKKLLETVSVDFNTTGKLLIIYFAFLKYLRKMGVQ